MRKVLPAIVSLACALWLGGLVALLMSVTTVFGISREIAVQVAPRLFHRFEPYLLTLVGVAIAATIAWRMLVSCSKAKKLLLALLLSAAVPAVVSIAFITPRIDALREAGQSQTPEFRRIHGVSNVLYLVQLALAAGCVITIPAAVRSES
jgi:hypothetical protein